MSSSTVSKPLRRAIQHVLTDDRPPIPKIIHQIWLDKKNPSRGIPQNYMTDQLVLGVQRVNPNFEHRVHTMEHVDALFDKHEDTLGRYRHFFHHVIHEHIEKCDFFRYMVLWDAGGVYMDLDVECLKPLDDLIAGRTMLLVHDHVHLTFLVWLMQRNTDVPTIFNGIMGSAPRQPFWLQLLDFIVARYDHAEGSGVQVLKNTGPHCVGRFAQIRQVYNYEKNPELYVNNCLLMPQSTFGKEWPECEGVDPYTRVLWGKGAEWEGEFSIVVGSVRVAISCWHAYLLLTLLLVAVILVTALTMRAKDLKRCEVKRVACERTCVTGAGRPSSSPPVPVVPTAHVRTR